jgi:hypothetical protein
MARRLREQTRDVEATLSSEIDVDQRDVWSELGDLLKRLGPRRSDADGEDPLTLEQVAGSLDEARGVVNDQCPEGHV